MKAHQRIIRETHANEVDPLLDEKVAIATSLDNAHVCEIDYQTAKEIILKYEWLGNMGSTDNAFGLYCGEFLAGVVCFGRTGGTQTARSVCGPQYTQSVTVLNRGACVHWAHPHSASFLIGNACRLMSAKGFHIFVAYSDPQAGEIGTVYQATNWHYCGTGNHAYREVFKWPGKPAAGLKDGKARDARHLHALTRIRADGDGPYQAKCTRREMRTKLERAGFVFVRTQPRHRYVTFKGDKHLVRELRANLRWEVLPYPKREE
jgi:hypothetical protein